MKDKKKTIEYVRKFCEYVFEKSLGRLKVRFILRGSELHKKIEKTSGREGIYGKMMLFEIWLFPSKKRELYIDVLLEEFVHYCRLELSEDETRAITRYLLPHLMKYLRINKALHGCVSPWVRKILGKKLLME